MSIEALDPLPVLEALDPVHATVAAAMGTTAVTVLALDLEALDLPGYGPIWTAITDLCAEGSNPCPPLVLDRLATTGQADPHAHNRLTRCITATVWPEQLREYAAAAVAARYRDEYAAMAVSLAVAAESGSESDLEAITAAHLATLRAIRTRLMALRGIK